MVNFDFLPLKFRRAVEKCKSEGLSELRVRTGFPLIGYIYGVKAYFSDNGETLDRTKAIICDDKDISDIIVNVTEHSLYAFNDRLKQGYLTTKTGVRIGVAGECVSDCGQVVTIKNVSSLNVRIPHEIKDCSKKIFDRLFLSGIKSTLIVSAPSKGKTTILKDLARKLDEFYALPILVIDERGEFESVFGENIDKIRFSDKFYALNYAIRSMSPHIVITDELQTREDWKSAENAVNGGIKIIASCHGKDKEDLKHKEFFNENVFERYVFLDADKKAGTVKCVCDSEFNIL